MQISEKNNNKLNVETIMKQHISPLISIVYTK